MAKITQTAGRNALGTFAPEFAHFNDDVLFGENWNNRFENPDMLSIILSKAILCCPCKFCPHICKCQQYSINLQTGI